MMQTHDISHEAHIMKGVLLCLLAYFFTSLIGVCEKSITGNIGIPVILFFQNAVCLLFILPAVARKGISVLKTTHVTDYIIRIGSGLGCYAVLFYIIRHIPITEALLFQYSASLWTPLIMLIWSNVRMPHHLWWGILVGFAGMVLILHPSSSMFGTITIMGILCGILQGISVVAIRKLSICEPILQILFYYSTASVLITLPFLFKHGVPLDMRDFILLLGVGVSTYLAQKFFTHSLRYANATTLSPISYTCILFSGLLGWLFWHEAPTKATLTGMLLIIAGCLVSLFTTAQNTKVAPKLEPEAP
jgi:drug/metabolite transporter (DMT)-like permease